MNMTKEQVKTAFEAVLGIPPRGADIAVIQALSGEGKITVETTAEFIWDHWMGEPKEPTVQQIVERIKEAIQ